MPVAPLQAVDRLAGRLRAALLDPARREWGVLAALAVYVALWTLYAVVAKSSQGLHYDMAELVAWSRDLALGYKHPPLAAWLVFAWFSIFPLADWSYYLLAMLMPALALWLIWRGAADYLDAEKRLAGVALLTLVPFFNFHALKFNVNTVLLPLWAAATFAFLRSYRTRSLGWAALAGVAAAACMLGKYWSAVLLLGLVIAALADKRRAAYFRSPAPWITVAVGLALLAPHLLWLWGADFEPFTYAASAHGAKPFLVTLVSALGYLGGSLAYVAIPLAAALIMARTRPATLADMAWPAERERRLAASAFWAPLLLPVVIAPAIRTEITSLWSMSAWSLLPVLLLSPEAVKVRALDTRRILIAALALPLIMLLASPIIAILAQRAGPPPAVAQARLLAEEVERDWRATALAPLRFVGGDADLAYGAIAYAADRPRALPDLPPRSQAELAQAGMVLVCFAEDAGCRNMAQAQAAHVGPSRTVVSEIRRNFLGFAGKPQSYALIIVPPHDPLRAQ
jgi:4-amino-4-deoxy-L-arabinose transferase-like glycosyltransferase